MNETPLLGDGPVLYACNFALPNAEKILARLLPSQIVRVGNLRPDQDLAGEILEKLATQQVAFFPEGSVSPDGAIHQIPLDIGWLVLTAKVPVIPVAIVPSIDNPEDDWELKYADQLDFSRYWSSARVDDATDRLLFRAVSDDIAASLVRLSGLDYHDCPASDHHKVRRSLLDRIRQGAETGFAAEKSRRAVRSVYHSMEIADIANAEAQVADEGAKS